MHSQQKLNWNDETLRELDHLEMFGAASLTPKVPVLLERTTHQAETFQRVKIMSCELYLDPDPCGVPSKFSSSWGKFLREESEL